MTQTVIDFATLPAILLPSTLIYFLPIYFHPFNRKAKP